MTYAEAHDLIIAFSSNQTQITKAVNGGRGITKKMQADESKLVAKLLIGLTGALVGEQITETVKALN